MCLVSADVQPSAIMRIKNVIRGILFDIDGTLIDSVDLHAECWQAAFKHFGYEIPFSAIRSQIGKGGDQLMPVFLPKEDLKSKGEDIQKYRKALYLREYLPKAKPFPEVPQLFKVIRDHGQQMALASSASDEELEMYKRLIPMEDYVRAATTADDADKSKPHPDIFEAAIKKLGLPPNELIVVGDSPYDAIAARKANVETVGVLCGGFPEKVLEEAGCIAIYQDPSDLRKNYEQSPLAGFPKSA
jgi:HAD superfamily hydrolase (TIGR01509 family)